MIGIYKITNLVNKKIYIGQSSNIEARWRAHRTRPFNNNSLDYESPLYRAIRKYGIENFSFSIVEQCKISELNDKEIYWISFYNSNDSEKGYNLTRGGQTSKPSKLKIEQVKEIQELLLNTTLSQEEISLKFNISQRAVSGINTGETWRFDNLLYPLRDSNEASSCKEKKYCLLCGNKISYGARLCKKCSDYNKRIVERPNREELKNMIREKSFLQIGRIYGVSDNTIRKWCRFYDLPYKKNQIKNFSEEEWNKV